MMFLSQRPNNDPKPFEIPNTYDALTGEGNVRLSKKADGAVLAPRPEFTQTRDPHPYVGPNGATRHAFPGWLGSDRLVWSPRHEEFDTPVNAILAAFRIARHGGISVQEQASGWLAVLKVRFAEDDATPEQFDHARRVLHLLAVISE